MAAGDTLWVAPIPSNESTATDRATPDRRNGHQVLDFRASTDDEAVWSGVMPGQYDGSSNILWKVGFRASTATSGEVDLQLEIERHQDDATGSDADSDSFGTANSLANQTTASASGEIKYVTVSISNANMDGIQPNEYFRVRFKRLGSTGGTDDMVGDMELQSLEAQAVA